MTIKRIYQVILALLLLVHISVWVRAGSYTFIIFLALFVGLAATLNIYQYLTGATMITGKVNIEPSQKGLRAFFFYFSVFLFIIGYGVSVGIFPST